MSVYCSRSICVPYSVPTGNDLAMEVCLMLTEVYITTYQLDKAVRYIEFIESELLKEERESKETEGHRSKLSLFKARLSLHHGNVKACKRDIKNFSTLAGNVRLLRLKIHGTSQFVKPCQLSCAWNVEILGRGWKGLGTRLEPKCRSQTSVFHVS